MRAKLITSLLFICLSAHAEEINEMSYLDFYKQLHDNSSLIKVKKYELEAEEDKLNQVKLFFLPKINADYTAKEKYGEDITEAKISANSTLFTTELNAEIKQSNEKFKLTKLSLIQEEERLFRLMIENVISIKVYNELLMEAEVLKKQSIDLYNQIDKNFQLGLAKPSDRNQGKLLIEKIQTDIESISREIELFKANIELATGVEYPEQGVEIDSTKLNEIENFVANDSNLSQNVDYQILKTQASIAHEEIKKQYPLFNVKLISEYKMKDGDRTDESYLGVQVGVNLFNYDNYSNRKSKATLYLAALEKSDYKLKELSSKLKTTSYTKNSNIDEMNSLKAQLDTTIKILNNQKSEYDISQSSYYEMLNTRYDLFSTKKRIADKKIGIYLNSIELQQLNGHLL
ncbi:TPA: TolC family protein [Vibrio parahaemolyticus]|nr:TolC family protein [Vibrio parahaemolyticus]